MWPHEPVIKHWLPGDLGDTNRTTLRSSQKRGQASKILPSGLSVPWPKRGRLYCCREPPNVILLLWRLLNVSLSFSSSVPFIPPPTKTEPSAPSTQLTWRLESLTDSVQGRVDPEPYPQPGSEAPLPRATPGWTPALLHRQECARDCHV